MATRSNAVPFIKVPMVYGSAMDGSFHISLGVKSMEDSITFYVGVLGATVVHRDPSGYVNLDLLGSQITLKLNPEIDPNVPDFHFGYNLELAAFDRLAETILARGRQNIVMEPRVVDGGTDLERKKMYLRCPSGYLIELKGYPAKRE